MTPVAVIREAAADGVSLALSPAGTIKATGDREAADRWLLVLRAHKPDILAALAHPGADLIQSRQFDLEQYNQKLGS